MSTYAVEIIGKLRSPPCPPAFDAEATSPNNHGAQVPPTRLFGGDRKALGKELTKARAMTRLLAERADEKRRMGEAMIREADDLVCQSWNERMWADGEQIDPSPTIDQAINGGHSPVA